MIDHRAGGAEGGVTPRRAIISVFDKEGLDRFVPRLAEVSPELVIYSTGGTHRRVAEILGGDAERRLTEVSAFTGQPEMEGGLVKTLDYRIYLGILGERDNPAHVADVERLGAEWIDLVAVNLYPFDKAVRSGDAESARSNIDIGGPAMLRAAAKNFLRVIPVSSPDQYDGVLEELRRYGEISLKTRLALASEAFRRTAEYDAAIAQRLAGWDPEEIAGLYARGASTDGHTGK